MSSLTSEARSICPELMEAVKLIDKLSYTRRYSEVFEDLVDWMVWQHQFPPNDNNPLEEKYSAAEQEDFLETFKVIQGEMKKRTNGETGDWYDPLGRLYETITSKHKSSAMGQYFTPKHVVDLMVNIQMGRGEEQEIVKILDPACGSGRMGLAAAANATGKGKLCWVTMNDLDPICTKMTAANMCMNGVIGEALCSNGLDITGESYRFGYRVEPIIAQIPQPMQETYRLMMMATTGQDITQQFIAKPVGYEQTHLKAANEQYLVALEESKKIADAKAQEEAVNALKEKVQARMQGTLFANDNTQAENVSKLTPKNESAVERERKRRKPPKDNQQTLF